MIKFAMKSQAIIMSLLTLVLCIALNSGLQSNAEDATKTSKDSVRSRVVLPEIFNFERFKQLYKKTYNSLIENLARKRIFLAKSFRAFISMVSYKHRRSSSYLSINQMSDWTPEEVRLTYNFIADGSIAFSSGSESDAVPVADISDIEEELEKIVEHQGDKPGFKEIAKELVRDNGLAVKDLLNKPALPDTDLSDTVPSNNPNYQQPELMSFASTKPLWIGLGEEKSAAIAKQPSFLASALQMVIGCFGFQEKKEQTELEDGMLIDHREMNCFFSPRDQGRCGSCYTFSTIALYEWYYCMATGSKVAFSEQYIVDCGDRVNLSGCSGGTIKSVGKFVVEYGLELRKHYPYRAMNGSCPYLPDEDHQTMGYIRVKDQGFNEVHQLDVDNELKKAPLVIGIKTGYDFSEYGGGVDNPKELGSGGHAMVVVGIGQEDGEKYWLIRNSHGFQWGEMGHYKLNKAATNIIGFWRMRKFKIAKKHTKEEISPQVRDLYHKFIEAENEEHERIRKLRQNFFRKYVFFSD